MFLSKIYIYLNPSVLDVEAKTIENSLKEINYSNIEDLKLGKIIEFKLNTKNKEEAHQQTKKMCKSLLVNLLIENYKYELIEV